MDNNDGDWDGEEDVVFDGILDEAIGDLQRKKLILWGVRTTIGVLLFGWLAKSYSWGKWVLIGWIPLAILSLLVTLLLPRWMKRRRGGSEGE